MSNIKTQIAPAKKKAAISIMHIATSTGVRGTRMSCNKIGTGFGGARFFGACRRRGDAGLLGCEEADFSGLTGGRFDAAVARWAGAAVAGAGAGATGVAADFAT